MDLAESVYSTFTKQELERLVAYRAAVAAGFYTDWDETTQTEEAADVQDEQAERGDSSVASASLEVTATPH